MDVRRFLPPPVLRAKQGVELKTRFVNELDREITLHWFGVRGPSELMSIAIEPGEENALDCNFTPPDAGTFWFGPISDASACARWDLYGMLVVEEKEAIPAFTDLPIVVDDWRLTNEGAIDQASFGSLEDVVGQGRMGNWFTANGVYRPRLAGGRGLIRLRLLNTANVRNMALLFKGADPWVIALDGQPVSPRRLGSSPLLLIPASAPISSSRRTIRRSPSPLISTRTWSRPSTSLAKARRKMSLFPTISPCPPIRFRATQASVSQDRSARHRGRREGWHDRSDPGRRAARLEGAPGAGLCLAFNGVAGLGEAPWQTFTKGDTVVLAIDNRTAFDQPLHIHGHVWQPVSDDIAGGLPWRDTALVKAHKTAKLAFVADNPGNWGLHSTIAERMGAGLFTYFAVKA